MTGQSPSHQGCTEVRWHLGQEASLVTPVNKCTVLKKILVALLGLFGTTYDSGALRLQYTSVS